MTSQISKLGLAIVIAFAMIGASASTAMAQTTYVIEVPASNPAPGNDAATQAQLDAAAAAIAAAQALATGDQVLDIVINTGGTSAPVITVSGSVVTVALPADVLAALDLTKNVTLQYNPVVFDGIVPANGIMTFNFPTDRTSFVLNITGTFKDGTAYGNSIAVSSGSATASAPLALTGSSVSQPALAGASLIGLGGIALLAARKRETSVA